MSKHTKSVFLYGKPTRIKLDELLKIQKLYTQLINTYIELLLNNRNLYLSIFLNDKKDSIARQFEKNQRNNNGLDYLGSALGQNAFDHAFKELYNHFTRIRDYMYGLCIDEGDILNFVSSITLLNAAICELDPMEELEKVAESIFQSMKKVKDEKAKKKYEDKLKYYNELLVMLKKHSKEDIQVMMSTVRTTFFEELAARRIPEVKEAPIQLDSRLCKIEEAEHIKADYVIRVKTLKKGEWMEIPLNTTRNSIRRLNQYKNGSPTIKVLKSGLIHGRLKHSGIRPRQKKQQARFQLGKRAVIEKAAGSAGVAWKRPYWS